MFGPFVYARDQQLQGKGAFPMTRGDYAAEILADLINRALVLQPLVIRAIEADDGARSGHRNPEYRQALEELAHAVGIFLQDAAEAGVRGQRARLFGISTTFVKTMETANDPDEAELEALGGAFEVAL